MEPITIAEAMKALGARGGGEGVGEVTGICTDTRQGAQGALFFALRGENADGHRYVARAFAAGAVAAVVERADENAGGPQLLVPDTLQALGDLARFYRDQFSLPVVGVTGSVGKTSTKAMIACALGARLRVLTSDKNFNNEIGVPLTLFNLDPRHEVAVLELAMRGIGQIARLAEIARPTLGVITNIGLSHVEMVGSRENLARAKGELLQALPPDGVAVLNADDDHFPLLKSLCACRIVTFGVGHAADFRATDVTFSSEGIPRFQVNGQTLSLQTPGVHHVANAAAACAVASTLGIPLSEAAAQLETFRAPAMRMETLQIGRGITILNDAYNAAPDSMRAALETLCLPADAHRRTVAVLGDMRELGDFSRDAHRYVGERAAAEDVSLLVTVGEAAQEIARTAEPFLGSARVHTFPDTDTAARAIPDLLNPGDVVLVKGSRAMEMEKIVRALQGH